VNSNVPVTLLRLTNADGRDTGSGHVCISVNVGGGWRLVVDVQITVTASRCLTQRDEEVVGRSRRKVVGIIIKVSGDDASTDLDTVLDRVDTLVACRSGPSGVTVAVSTEAATMSRTTIGAETEVRDLQDISRSKETVDSKVVGSGCSLRHREADGIVGRDVSDQVIVSSGQASHLNVEIGITRCLVELDSNVALVCRCQRVVLELKSAN